jgi:hypothetical protein
MKVDGELILEIRFTGFGSGQVFIHENREAHMIYSGPGAQPLYDVMKRFIKARHNGSGDWFEESTNRGLKWRERASTGFRYGTFDE